MARQPKTELTEVDRLFIDTYFNNGFNATQAYLTAYPKALYKTARFAGYRLLAQPVIKEEVERVWAEIKELNIITREEVMIALKESMDRAIESEDNNDLLKTIDIINKMTGAYTLQIDANVNNNIILTIPGLEPEKEEDENPE